MQVSMDHIISRSCTPYFWYAEPRKRFGQGAKLITTTHSIWGETVPTFWSQWEAKRKTKIKIIMIMMRINSLRRHDRTNHLDYPFLIGLGCWRNDTNQLVNWPICVSLRQIKGWLLSLILHTGKEPEFGMRRIWQQERCSGKFDAADHNI